MERITIPRKGWVLVCDGAKALLFQNMGESHALDLKLAEMRREAHPPTRDLGTERPGRVHESVGTARSSMEPTDWHALAEADFLRGIATEIDEVVRTEAVRHLTLVAPPRALGVLRQHLTPAVQAVVGAQVDKDLAQLSTAEIEKHLAAMSQLS